MATLRQKKVARAIVDGLTAKHPPTKQEIVESAGYSNLTATHASKQILENKGVQESLVSFGFDESRAKAIVGEILEAGENDLVKLKAADMVFKVHGTYAPEKKIVAMLPVENIEKLKKIAEKVEEELYGTDRPT